MVFAFVGFLVLALITDLVIWWWQPSDPGHREISGELPPVTILVAMRNEEENLPEAITQWKSVDYPRDKIQLLIGEDRSEDRTSYLLEQLAREHSGITIIPIREDIGLKGKANVIAQLIPHAHHEHLFITDADVRVPPSWIKTYMAYAVPGPGVIGASTVVNGENLWCQLQNMDWLLAQAMLCTAGARISTLAISGTNMMITKSACDAIGGYEKIPYSLTEDIGFLTAARARGLECLNLWDAGATAAVQGQKDWPTLLQQRSRWTYGATKLLPAIVLVLLIRTLFLPVVIALAVWQPWWALFLLVVRLTLQGCLIKGMASRLKQEWKISALLVFEVYYTLVTLGGLILYMLPLKFYWKGRKYS